MDKFNRNNCLFLIDKEAFLEIERIANQLHSNSYLIQSPFALKERIKEYALKNDVIVKIMYVPMDDSKIWGMFYEINGIYFIAINNQKPMNKQLVALAHEFYHFYAAINESASKRDILLEDQGELLIEDKKANAFAATYLMPEATIRAILKPTDSLPSKVLQIKLLMGIFMIPYKTAVLRLLEIGFISEDDAEILLNKTSQEVEDFINSITFFKNNVGEINTENVIDLDDLDIIVESNENLELISSKKLKIDKDIILQIRKEFSNNKWRPLF